MTIHEQRMCEEQAIFFELSLKCFSCSSSYFVARFMNSDIASELDNIDDPYNFISPNNLITAMANKYPSLNEQEGIKASEKAIKWIGYIYRAYAIIKKTSSSKTYKDLKFEKMVSLYDSFHTFDPDYCVDRLEEIIKQAKPVVKTDYEIFKEIYSSK